MSRKRPRRRGDTANTLFNSIHSVSNGLIFAWEDWIAVVVPVLFGLGSPIGWSRSERSERTIDRRIDRDGYRKSDDRRRQEDRTTNSKQRPFEKKKKKKKRKKTRQLGWETGEGWSRGGSKKKVELID